MGLTWLLAIDLIWSFNSSNVVDIAVNSGTPELKWEPLFYRWLRGLHIE